MRYDLRLRGRTADGTKCVADVSVYASSLKQLKKQADHAAKSAAWMAEAAPHDPIPEGSTIIIEHVEKI